FETGGMVFALYGKTALAQDAHLIPEGADFGGIAPASRGCWRIYSRGAGAKCRLKFLLCCRCCQALLPIFFLPCILWALGYIAPTVWWLPMALGPRVSNNLLSVRVQPPVTRFSLRLSTTPGRPVGGDPIYPTASLKGPEVQRAASTSTKDEPNSAPK